MTIGNDDIPLASVRRALAQLPEQQRNVLLLVCVDGMSYRETAQALDIPPSEIARRIAQARKALHAQVAVGSRTTVRRSAIPIVPTLTGGNR